MNNSPIVIALDYADESQALALVKQLNPQQCRLKVGFEMFTRFGPAWVERLSALGFEVFLDLKFHDIPNTVAASCRAAADLGVWMVNVHACGGPDMLCAAREAIDKATHQPLLIGVTVLTSTDQQQLHAIGIRQTPKQRVLQLVTLCQEAKLDGVVCSAQEAAEIRKQAVKPFVLVAPGIRPTGAPRHDQKRVVSPSEALALGIDYVVIGRPITLADDPAQVLADIYKECATA